MTKAEWEQGVRVGLFCKPIPTYDYDWEAVEDDRYDGPGSPIGYGRTVEAAIADLFDQIQEDYEWDEGERGGQ